MKIELKNIKHSEFASQETHCYEASLYVNGSRIGVVGNEGHGGPDFFYPTGDVKAGREAYKLADKWCRENLPKWECGDDMIDTDLEMHCGDLVNAYLATSEVRKLMRSKVLYKPHGKSEIHVVSWKNTKKVGEQHIAAVRAKPEAEIILNDLPVDKAVDLFRTYA